MHHWLLISSAILMEVLGTISMKLSLGFTKIIPSISIFVFYALSFTFMTLALKKLELSIVYAVWAGVGTALITIIGFTVFGDKVTTIKILSILMIIIGVVGLNIEPNSMH